MTKDVSSTLVTVPDTFSYLVIVENAGPGPATNVRFTDELSPDVEWSIGSGSNVCSIDGTTLSCFAPIIPDGVFEVVEIIGTVDADDCGTYDNTGTLTFEGGPESGSVSDSAPTVEVTGCSGEAPSETTPATPVEGAGAGGDGDLPDTSAGAPAPIAWSVVALALLAAASVVTLRARRRS
jgi:uncharacterized repeat protein (TIGR01451 family)